MLNMELVEGSSELGRNASACEWTLNLAFYPYRESDAHVHVHVPTPSIP